jgi:hypothetical protein
MLQGCDKVFRTDPAAQANTIVIRRQKKAELREDIPAMLGSGRGRKSKGEKARERSARNRKGWK